MCDLQGKLVFATVGTTKFDLMIKSLTQIEVLQALKDNGYSRLILQIGNGKEIPNEENARKVQINISYYRFKKSIVEDIEKADLIISHAGAGTCLEVLEKYKPLLVVVNEELMHNHQTELADQLSLEGYLYACKCCNLKEAIQNFNFQKLKIIAPVNSNVFSNYLDKFMGFNLNKV